MKIHNQVACSFLKREKNAQNITKDSDEGSPPIHASGTIEQNGGYSIFPLNHVLCFKNMDSMLGSDYSGSVLRSLAEARFELAISRFLSSHRKNTRHS